jgi:hypothetical protein
MGASLNRHTSKQDLGTPREFIRAVEKRWGPLAWDLAASAANTKAPRYLGKRVNSLKQDWTDILIFKNLGTCRLTLPERCRGL